MLSLEPLDRCLMSNTELLDRSLRLSTKCMEILAVNITSLILLRCQHCIKINVGEFNLSTLERLLQQLIMLSLHVVDLRVVLGFLVLYKQLVPDKRIFY